MNSTDKFFRESHYNILRGLLGTIGLWPFHSKARRYAIFLGSLALLTSGKAFETFGMIEIWENTMEFVDSLPVFILNSLCIYKLAGMACVMSKLSNLFLEMERYWYSPKTDGETKILHSNAIYSRKFGFAYAVIILGHSAVFLSMGVVYKFIHVETNKTADESTNVVEGVPPGLPCRVNYFVDLDTYFIPIFIHITSYQWLLIICLVAIDVLYFTLVQHCCSLLEALRYILENSHEDDVDGSMAKLTEHSKHSKAYSIVAYGARRHAEAIQFIDNLESLFRIPLLVHMGCMISMISIVGFQVLTNTNSLELLLRHFAYFNASVLNAFFENWQGQKIIDYSEQVYTSAYNSRWYEMPNKARKLLIMIMLRSIKPSQITAGKVIVMSYENFNAVMRLSSSYFMLLRSMQ